MKKFILKCDLSPGDIVMLTAAVRDLHRCYPGRFATDVRTRCSDLWENNPHLTALRDGDPGAEQIECSYPLINQSNTAPYHALHGFIEFLNGRLRLQIRPTVFKGDIHLSKQEKIWHSQVREVTGEDTPFWIIAAGGKYDLTIKWWQSGRYQEVVDHFRGKIQFVQVGQHGHHHPRLNGVIDLRGRTTLRELVRLVYHSSGVLCSVTSLMHLAAAVETKRGQPPNRPCVVIAGGREPPHWEAYPQHQFIHTSGALACCTEGGCWRDRTVRLRDGDHRDRPNNLCVDVIDGIPRCMDLIQPQEAVRRIEGYFNGGVARYLSPRQSRAAERGIAATRRNPFDNQPLTLSGAGLACDQFIKTIPDCPPSFNGRGIVISAGGVQNLANAWVCVNMLRHFGCALPIQFWHLGKKELDRSMQTLLAPLGVESVDALGLRKKFPARILKVRELKSYALLHSPFREALLLDAGNVPGVNPEFLFDAAEFRDAGAVFWPGQPRRKDKLTTAIWRSFGLRVPDEPEFATGQILVDKQKSWPALCLAGWINENSDFFHQYTHGDREAFHLAFRKMKKNYSLVQKPVHPMEGTLCQHDFQGRRIFQHRTSAKRNLVLNKPVKGFWLEEQCHGYLAELKRVWDGRFDNIFRGDNPIPSRI